MEVSFLDVGADVVCVCLFPCCPCVAPTVSDNFMCGIFCELEHFARPFVVGKPSFSASGGRVVRVPTWILVRTLWAVDRGRLVCFLFSLPSPAGAAVWLGARGEVGASNGMIAVAMSRVRWRFVVPVIVCRGRGSCGTVACLTGASGQDDLVLGVACLG